MTPDTSIAVSSMTPEMKELYMTDPLFHASVEVAYHSALGTATRLRRLTYQRRANEREEEEEEDIKGCLLDCLITVFFQYKEALGRVADLSPEDWIGERYFQYATEMRRKL